VYLIQVSLLIIGQQGLVDFFDIGIEPCFLLTGGLCKFYANAGGKEPIHRQPLLVQYKHQTTRLLSMKSFTSFVISINDKNKQLTCQHKLALTTINKPFAL
jgi:hypothetical protein